MAKTLSRPKTPWGPNLYYEGKPSFRKTTALRKRNTKTKEGRHLRGNGALEKRTLRHGTQHAPADRGGTPGPERISIAVGNIPAPGLGRVGAMQRCYHAEVGVNIFVLNPDVSILMKLLNKHA